MKKMLLIIILSVIIKFAFASSPSLLHYGDTTVNPKEYKLNQKEFLEKYGRDDSSKALIQFYFHRRNMHKAAAITGASMGLVASIAVFPVKNMPDDNYYEDEWDFFPTTRDIYAIGIIALATAGLVLVITGGSLWMRYSRKKLLHLLDDYFNGKSIPKAIARSIVFRAYLQYGEWNHHIKNLIKSTDYYNRKKLRERKLMSNSSSLSTK